MRKYRGKTKAGKWVLGWYVENWDYGIRSQATGSYIIDEFRNWYIVIPETVGQSTGLQDERNVEIFEGDMVKVSDYYIGDSLIKANRGEVKYGNGSFYISYEFSPTLCNEEIYNNNIEIIGNIHDKEQE